MKKHLLSLVLIVSFVFAFIPRTFAEEITEPVLDMNANEIAVNETNNINDDVNNDANSEGEEEDKQAEVSDGESDDKQDDESVVGQDGNSDGEEEITSEPENSELELVDDQEEENENIEEGNNSEVEDVNLGEDDGNNSSEENENNKDGYEVIFTREGYKLVIPGGSSILLSQLNTKLGIDISLSQVKEISISNQEVLRLVKVENSNDYVIQSIKSFDTEEELRILTTDGYEYLIKVVDPVGDTPDHNKVINDNGDGTYTISLDVTGESETKVETAANVNVLIIYDVSSSMTSNNVTTNPNRNRADYAEDVVHDFVDSLRQYQNTSDPSNIQVALVTFGPTATGRQTWTSDLTNGTNGINRFFDDGVDGTVTSSHNYNRNNGTNWEHALQQAQTYLRTADSDPTFVILVTDGAPTANGTNGNNPGNPAQMSYNQFYTRYGFATDEARAIQTRDNTTLFGIYAYGREADLLDDLIYYSNTGSERSGMSAATDATENYYNASDTAALNSAIESIFGKIVETLGVGSVNISDGTTSVVAHEASNEVSHLLDVDEESFEYWLTIPVVNNEFKRTDLVSGEEITYQVTNNSNGTATVTWGSNSVTVDGSVSAGKLKYKWTEANALYNVAHPEATIENGAVKWNLESIGTLLNGVTYTVTFDVWPSQTTLDLIADLKNKPSKYDTLDANIKKYLVNNEDGTYTLLTNTTASLSFKDTREDNPQTHTEEYTNPDPVSTNATQMLTITKEWSNSIDEREKREIKIDILRDGESWFELTLNNDNNYQSSANIAVGIMTVDDNGEVDIKASGHDFSFGELGKEAYNWELKSEVVRPMMLNGELTILIRQGTEKPSEGTYYKIGDYYYTVGTLDEGVAKLTATNERRSWIDLEKTVNYDKNAAQFEDQLFTFDITVGETGGEDVWFSVKVSNDANAAFATEADGLVVENATAETDDNGNTGYYYATSGSTFTVKIKAGWNLRIINLLTGTTYTIIEKDIDSKFEFENITFNPTTDVEGNAYEPTVNKNDYSVSGEIQKANVKYGYEYINKNVNTEIVVTKVWEDNDDANKNRPSDVVLKLSDGTTVLTQPTKVENENGTWTYTYTGLPVYDGNGDLIEYTLTEDQVLGYKEAVITGDAKVGFTVTNTLETVSVTVKKDWQDNDNQDGIRPDSITLTLSDGTEVELNEDNNWEATIEDLPKYKNKEEVTYTVEEKNVPNGYDLSYSEDHLTAINTHTPETSDVEVTKVWEDNNNEEGLRPDEITIHLYANGEEVDATPEIVKNDDNTWTITYKGLDVYADGEKIEYTVTEDEVEYYETSIKNLTITNSRDIDTIELTVKKVWDDNDNQDGKRPEKLTVTLNDADETEVTLNETNQWTATVEVQKYVGGVEYEYTWTEEDVDDYDLTDTKVQDGTTTFTNTHTPEKDDVVVTKVWEDSDNEEGLRPDKITIHLYANGEEVNATPEVVKNEDNTWTITYSDLDVYAEGEKIEYTVTEDEVKYYETSIKNLTITNSRDVEYLEIKVQKVWDDSDNAEGFRPEDVTVNLLANDEVIDTVKLNINNSWEYSWSKLNKYIGGKEVTYSFSEDPVDKYEADIQYDETRDIFVITNSREVETKDITVKKIWKDSDNKDGFRLESITIILYANGEEVGKTELSGEGNEWTYTFKGLNVYANAEEIKYTINEIEVDNYETEVDGFTITNTHEVKTTSVKVTKVWKDDEKYIEEARPESVTIFLYANGEKVGSAELSETNDWTYTFEELDLYLDGEKIEYTVDEQAVAGYDKTITGDQEEGFTITNTFTEEIGDLLPPITGIESNENNSIIPFIFLVVLLILEGISLRLNKQN